MKLLTIALREIKLGFRNSWTYTFLILLSIFTVAILLIQSGVAHSEGYTDTTGAMMNITLYLLPLITLLLGSISTVTEKEDGHWGLLSTYTLSLQSFLWGKWIGLAIILLTMLAFSFGLAGMITVLFGNDLSLSSLIFFWIFSSLLAVLYLGISIAIGAMTKNRWQALIGGIGVWFVTVIFWPTLLISVLHLFPYSWIQPTLEIGTILNPAEMVRVFSMVKLGAGAVFGSEYNTWISWINGPLGTPLFIFMVIFWIVIMVSIGAFIWERRDRHQ